MTINGFWQLRILLNPSPCWLYIFIYVLKSRRIYKLAGLLHLLRAYSNVYAYISFQKCYIYLLQSFYKLSPTHKRNI